MTRKKTPSAPALPVITDEQWERMTWRARQQWLLAANALRRQIKTELAAIGREHRSTAAHRLGLTVAFDVIVADGDARGNHRLTEAADEAIPYRAEHDQRAS